ncbi:NAD-dependent epimerase/dehydratase family protein [Geomonas subterranea]|uniref:NAD-dependent epimerase/dehydratase family protein n=1 Tax=Geomonas subterranea TaxID=2847989 RepID=A0ABX8LBS6_9BACT|nr:hopanoid-associated sugar epimerase [Geomonas subterranea]QXE89128.1 NAD-dependent epimerase/dehydratase family protein [Geomonas subterranea]QXM08754.1 NAD-dependent epimerase/dehydratase family protein [Geomonas subterranea]
MRAFVTGATGFIGASIVRELLKDGYRVRVLVRRGSDRRNLAGLDLELHEGDLSDRQALVTALSGCDLLFHAAADYRLWTRTPQAMYDANVLGTRNILSAALAAGVGKVVYTSSVGTLGNPGDGTPGNEETPVDFNDMVGDYKKSKFLAERAAESYLDKGLPLVIVNPSTPVGPMDVKPTPTGKIIVDFLNGKMPAYLDTGLNLIDVEACARGHLLAAQKGRIGQKYILGNRNLTLAGIFEMLSALTGLKAPRVKLPYYPILMAAYANHALSLVTRREPLIPLAGVQMARKFMYFDSAKAQAELGVPQTPVEDALERAVKWFKDNGYIQNR